MPELNEFINIVPLVEIKEENIKPIDLDNY